MTPTVGRIVHYVLHDGPHQGFHRPALVVAHSGMTVNVQVFTDGNKTHGDLMPNVFWRYNVAFDPDGKQVGTWHWPEGAEEHSMRSVAFAELAHAPHTAE